MKPDHPDLLIDNCPVGVAWQDPQPILGWVRYHAQVDAGIVAQAFVHPMACLVDVFNNGPGPRLVEFADMPGCEFGRSVPPGAGLGITIELVDPPIVEKPWDAHYDPWMPWDKVDVGYTPTTGSPRNFFYSPHSIRAAQVGVSVAMTRWLDRFARWQLMRTYQSADARALPSWSRGQPIQPAPWVEYEGLGTVTPYDTHHLTIGTLTDAWLLTGNIRALDQLIRCMVHAVATQDYYNPAWPWPYGGVTRVPGWLFTALADMVCALTHTGLTPFMVWARQRAQEHVDLVTSIGFENGRPAIVNAPDPGRHLPVPFNMPWQDAIVAWGAEQLAREALIPGAAELAAAYRGYLLEHGWDAPNGCAYDSIAHHLAVSGEPEHPPKGGACSGIGLWPLPAFLFAEDIENGLCANITTALQALKISGKPVWSVDSDFGLSLAGPLIV